jgi:hypothetical protein
MNQTQHTLLLEVLAVIPDPRKARGQRYAWALLLTLLAAVRRHQWREWLATLNALVQVHITHPHPTFLGPFEGI